jgi:exosortase
LSLVRKLVPWMGLLFVVGIVYAPVVTELVRDWIRDPNYSHGFLIPVVSGVLIWRGRVARRNLPCSPSNWGLLGILVAVALLVLGSAAAEVFTQRVSLVVFLASLVLFMLGWRRLRAVAFPIGFLLLAIPLPYVIYYGLTSPMQTFAARSAVVGLKVIGVPALREGNVIHLQGASLEVAEACSGIRSLYSFLALGALLAYSTTIPLWGRLLVFLLTIPLSVAANAFRVWSTGVGTVLIGPRATSGTVHELFGLIVFATALGVLLLFRHGARRLWSSVR